MNKFLNSCLKGLLTAAISLGSLSYAQNITAMRNLDNTFSAHNTFQLGEVLGPKTFAALPASTTGGLIWCSDCVSTDPCASGGNGALAVATGSQWSCSATPGPNSGIAYINKNNLHAAGTYQYFQGDPNGNLPAFIVGLQGGVAFSATPGSVFGWSQALTAQLPRLGWFDGQLASVFLTSADTGCDLVNACSGDSSFPLATQKSPQFITPFVDNATAISLSVPTNPNGNFLDLLQGVSNPYCQYTPTALHIYICYGSDNNLQGSNNGGAFSDFLFASSALDPTKLSTFVPTTKGGTGADFSGGVLNNFTTARAAGTSTTQTGNLSNQTVIATTPASTTNYIIWFYDVQVAAGSTCATTSTIANKLTFNDPGASGVATRTAMTATITGNGAGNSPLDCVGGSCGGYFFQAKASTAIGISTTFTKDGSCASTTPSYKVSYVIQQL